MASADPKAFRPNGSRMEPEWMLAVRRIRQKPFAVPDRPDTAVGRAARAGGSAGQKATFTMTVRQARVVRVDANYF